MSKTTNFLQTVPGLLLALVCCPILAIVLVIKYDYPINRWLERTLGAVAGCYIAIVAFAATSTVEARAATVYAEERAAIEAELVTVEMPIVSSLTISFE